MRTNKRGLLPCPFCGEIDDITITKKYHKGAPVSINGCVYWRVECLPCDARTGHFFEDDEEIFYGETAREAAISSWNRRKQAHTPKCFGCGKPMRVLDDGSMTCQEEK